ncbi:hypothetical protein M011DRAFT_226550 [Sporormia fimetaria CBS 119925]|uniref:Uncharacterized protein n=1 Tax=Sporormia fimetaria CBS 119925 TaxID=1340428 RepID=A0A6A6V1L7_9PLEO|nr:hypothetical protein M011DRAFT_226550 [Sporormia fimetaria CBS 119925]
MRGKIAQMVCCAAHLFHPLHGSRSETPTSSSDATCKDVFPGAAMSDSTSRLPRRCLIFIVFPYTKVVFWGSSRNPNNIYSTSSTDGEIWVEI